MDPNVKDSIVARLKEATNVLVTVSNNPSVDQLAACIGFTLLLNKVGKRGAAVFSGAVPSTLEFLQPDKTIEKNTDSLRDFIIALDKSKADKLRYKVEDKVVKIFITPYRTSISDKDLDFSQGDFNVDVVIALGVHQKSELDEAIVSHGRILHDATVISVNNKDQGNLGTLNWVDLQSSSLSEMMASIGQQLGGAEAFDNQIATALMTGIVAETDRFSNEKTSPATMKLASELMGAGANQQLIATKLGEPGSTLGSIVSPEEAKTDADGELTITHDRDTAEDAAPETADVAADTDGSKVQSANDETPEFVLPEPQSADESTEAHTDSSDTPDAQADESPIDDVRGVDNQSDKPTTMTLDPPKLGGKLTANSEPEHLNLDPSTDPMSVGAQKSEDGILSRKAAPSISPLSDMTDENEPPTTPEATTDTSPPSEVNPVDSTPPMLASDAAPLEDTKEEQVDDARDAVEDAIREGGDPEKNLEPIQALGSQPVNLDLGHEPSQPSGDTTSSAPATDATPPATEKTPEPEAPPYVTTSTIPPVPSMPPANDAPSSIPQHFPPPPASPDLSMPPNPLNTPPAPANPPMDNTPFVNPSQPAMPDVSPLVPSGAPMDQSGASGPATPPPPVPPPMMPQIPPAPANSNPQNPNQPL